jgi:hypothetical protein
LRLELLAAVSDNNPNAYCHCSLRCRTSGRARISERASEGVLIARPSFKAIGDKSLVCHVIELGPHQRDHVGAAATCLLISQAALAEEQEFAGTYKLISEREKSSTLDRLKIPSAKNQKDWPFTGRMVISNSHHLRWTT